MDELELAVDEEMRGVMERLMDKFPRTDEILAALERAVEAQKDAYFHMIDY